MQAPSVVVHRQMALVPVTIQLHQNHMLLTSGRNRIFLDAGAFRCKMAPALVIIQFDQNHMLFTVIATEYSWRQAPSIVVRCQLAPESVTSQ
jgi:hypothetical protein